MRILHCTTFYPPWSFGGDANYVRDLSRMLVSQGHHVEVVHCLDAFVASGGNIAATPKLHEDDGVIVHSLKSRAGILSPLLTHQTSGAWFKGRKIAEILRSKSFDVIHMHNMSLMGLGVLDYLPENEQQVTLYTAHEHWLVCPTHVLWKYTNEVCETPACARCTISHRRPPQTWRLTGKLNRFANGVDVFLSPSKFSAKTHRERGFPSQMTNLPNFAKPSSIDFANPPVRPHDRPYGLYVGRLERIKGVETLIRAWDAIPDADLIIAGEGCHGEEFRHLAKHNPRIRFLGWVSQAQLDTWYYHALATIVPSLCHEVFPLVCIESLARRTPLICRDFGSLAEVVADSGGGLLYQDQEQLVKAVQSFADSPSLRQKLGNTGHEKYLQDWTPEAHLRMYLELIASIQARKSDNNH